MQMPKKALTATLLAAGLAACGASSPPQSNASSQRAEVTVDEVNVRLRTAHGSVIITREPLSLRFEDDDGRTVLGSSASARTPAALMRLPLPQRLPGGAQNLPQAPSLHAPLAFVVGRQTTLQFPATFWVGNLLSAQALGVEYRLTDVIALESATPEDIRLRVATSDPSGREAILRVAPDAEGAFRLSLRLDPVDEDVALVSAAFASGTDEAFRGFGGRRNTLNQRGEAFLNWAEELSVIPEQFEAVGAAFGDTYQFPTGPQGAYYVQSQFISSRDYGFLLEQDALSHWRMASEREDVWQVEVAGDALDIVVVPGEAPEAIERLTALTGRHDLPPEWALGPMLSETVQFSDSPESYDAKVQESLRMIAELELPLSAFLFEGWVGLEQAGSLRPVIAELRGRGIKPVTYYRAFVGADDDLLERHEIYDEALREGYVATHADGRPYRFGSPLLSSTAALIDFTDPEAVAWWKARIKRGLDMGVEGFMQDFGEQTFVDMRFDDGSSGIDMHNRYAKLFHRASRDAIDEYRAEHPEREPWFYVRFGSSGRPGSAAFEPASWPGDNTADWSRGSGIGSVIPDMLNRGIGGAYGFVSEIGGYADIVGRIDTELFTRWAQMASLMPVHRLHGGPVNGTPMPWRLGEAAVAAYRASAQRHIAAQPLIMRLWREARATGMPIARPLWLAFPDEPGAAEREQQFMLGEAVLVAPVVTPSADGREVYFPSGCWERPETGSRHEGPGVERVAASLGQLPYYFRCGSRPFPVPEGGFG